MLGERYVIIPPPLKESRCRGPEADKKHCYITGGSAGLGKALAALLVKKGAHVTIVARDPGRLEAAEKELKVSPSKFSFIR